MYFTLVRLFLFKERKNFRPVEISFYLCNHLMI